MRRWLRTYRSYLVPVMVSVVMGVSTATAACVVVIQVQCQPTCDADPQSAALGSDGSTPADPVPSPEPSSPEPGKAETDDLTMEPSPDSQSQNYSATGQEASPDPAPSDPAAGAVLAALDALRQQEASCPVALVVDETLQSVAALQAEVLQEALPDQPSDRTDSAGDRARAAGFTGRVVEIVVRGAGTTKDLAAALSVGRYGRIALDCSLTSAGVGVGNGVVVIEMGATA